MSDHVWASEQIVAFVVGGLTAEEAARLEAHVSECPDCAAAVADARRLDHGLGGLFAEIRIDAGLEDRAVRATRAERRRRFASRAWLPRLAIAAGVLFALTSIGALAGALVGDGRLPLPGNASLRSTASAEESHVTREAGDPLYESIVRQMKDLKVSRNYGGYEALADAKSDKDSPAGGKGFRALDGGEDDTRHLTTRATSRIQTRPDGRDGQLAFPGQTLQSGGGQTPSMLNSVNGGTSNGISGGNGTLTTNATPTVTGGTTLGLSGLPKGSGQGTTPQFFGYFQPSANYWFRTNELQPERQTEQKGQDRLGEDGQKAQELAVPALATDFTAKSSKTEATPPAEPESATHRVIIRSGEIEFEVQSFDAAAAIVTKLVNGLKGAFIATINSDKLANGKVRGSITVRTPPEYLDRLVLDLRREIGATGELKGLKIGSQDVTKQYTDLESRLRGAKTMEQRLLQIIKEGKGEIKQLLEAEKELGVWRTRIEEIEGELRYYSNLVALSTLTITLTEKEIRAAAAITENERVQAGVEVEDVDKAYQQARAVVAEFKGRVAKSELKQLAAGQFNASLQFDVPPDASGPVRDRLRQLGRVARLEIDRSQHAVGGSLPADAKVTRGDTTFLVQIYNLANVAPRETAMLQVAVPDVRAAFQALRDVAAKAAGRVRAAQLNEQDAQNVTAQFDVEIRRADEGMIRTALDTAGEVVSRQVTRVSEGDDFTDSKVLYRITLLAASRLNPRETTTMTLEVPDVEQTTALFAAQVAEAKGRQVSVESTRDRAGKVTAKVVYEVPLAAAGLADRFKAAGTVRGYQSIRDPQAPAGKYATARLALTLVSGEQIVGEGDGLWPQVRRGLSYSMTVLLVSVTWVVFGLCVVLPWGLVGYAGYRLVRRLSRRPVTVT